MKKIFYTTIAFALWLQSLVAQNNRAGINTSIIDKTTAPGKDFFQFACGNWMKATEIPSTESSWGAFNEIRDRNELFLRKILEEVSANKSAANGTTIQKVRDYYNLAMDTLKLEKDGIKPINPYLEEIKKSNSTQALIKLWSKLQSFGISVGFDMSIYNDAKNSSVNIIYFSQGGFFLPDRDFYFLPKYEKIKNAYVEHIEHIFKLSGENEQSAKKIAVQILKLETEMASASMNRMALRDLEAQYNKLNSGSLFAQYPALEIQEFLKIAGIQKAPDSVIVSQPDYMKKVNALMKEISLEDWKTYTKWCLLHGSASKLNAAFEKENFNFYSTILSGVQVQKPRWKIASGFIDNGLGDALGQIYVEKHFNDQAKKKVNAMVDNLMAAYLERIKTRSWMSEETKKNAEVKLTTIVRKLAFPDKWKDYSSLEIKNDAFISNYFRCNNFTFKEMIADLNKPVDKTRWGMTPPTVNAYYNPLNNEIAFPAGIMQAPFFDPNADDAFNYGIMGAIIGHELTHGFDDQGAQFDEMGNMKNWWTQQDLNNFKMRTELLKKQFDDYIAIDSTRVNGSLTLGENIADLGGLTMSYYAYKKSLNGKPSEVIEGFTGEQRFFLAWAQGWKIKMRPEALKQMIATNPHSPGYFRANGPLSNMTEFYEAFGIKEGDNMYRKKEERVEIW